MASFIEEHENALVAMYAEQDYTTPDEWRSRCVHSVIRQRYREKDAAKIMGWPVPLTATEEAE